MTETEIENLVVRLTGDGQGYLTMLKQAQSHTVAAANTMEKATGAVNSFSFGMRNFALRAMGALAPLAGAIGLLGGAFRGVKLAAQAEEAEIAFSVLLGSMTKAKKLTEELAEFAGSTPFSIEGVEHAAKTMLQFNVAQKDIIPTMQMLGDISVGNAEKFNSLVLAFGRIQASGRLTSRDLFRMKLIGFDPLREISKATGETMDSLNEKLQDGLITTEQVTNAFKKATGEGGKFHGALDKMDKSLKGTFSSMQAAIDKFFLTIGQHLVDMLHLKDVMNAISEAVKGVTKWVKELSPGMRNFLSIVLLTTTAVGFLTLAWPLLAAVAVKSLRTILTVVDILLGPINLLGIAIAAIGIPLLIAYIKEMGGLTAVWDNLRKAAVRAWDWIKPVLAQIKEMFRVIVELGGVAYEDLRKVVLDTWYTITYEITRLWERAVEKIKAGWNWVTDFVRDNRSAVLSFALLTGAVAAVAGAVKLLVVAFGILKAMYVGLIAMKVVLIAKWIIWTAAVLVAIPVVVAFKTAIWLVNVALVALKVMLVTTSIAIVVMNALLAGTAIAGAIVTLGALAVTLAAIGSAAWAAFKTFEAMFNVLGGSDAFSGPLAEIGKIFGHWGDTLKEVWRVAQFNAPKAWELLRAAATLAISEVQDLFPRLWTFIKDTSTALWKFVADKFEAEFGRAFVNTLNMFREWTEAIPGAGKLIGKVNEVLFGDLDAKVKKMNKAVDELGEGLDKTLRMSLTKAGREFGEKGLINLPFFGKTRIDTEATRQARETFNRLREESGKLVDPNAKPWWQSWLDDAKAKEEADKAAEDAAKGFGKIGEEAKKAAHEVGKFDHALFGSAEALGRIAAQQDKIFFKEIGAEVAKKKKGRRGFGAVGGPAIGPDEIDDLEAKAGQIPNSIDYFPLTRGFEIAANYEAPGTGMAYDKEKESRLVEAVKNAFNPLPSIIAGTANLFKHGQIEPPEAILKLGEGTGGAKAPAPALPRPAAPPQFDLPPGMEGKAAREAAASSEKIRAEGLRLQEKWRKSRDVEEMGTDARMREQLNAVVDAALAKAQKASDDLSEGWGAIFSGNKEAMEDLDHAMGALAARGDPEQERLLEHMNSELQRKAADPDLTLGKVEQARRDSAIDAYIATVTEWQKEFHKRMEDMTVEEADALTLANAHVARLAEGTGRPNLAKPRPPVARATGGYLDAGQAAQAQANLAGRRGTGGYLDPALRAQAETNKILRQSLQPLAAREQVGPPQDVGGPRAPIARATGGYLGAGRVAQSVADAAFGPEGYLDPSMAARAAANKLERQKLQELKVREEVPSPRDEGGPADGRAREAGRGLPGARRPRRPA